MIVGDNKQKYFGNSKCLSLFLSDIRRIPLITPDEEEELVYKYQGGDLSAKQKIIESNLRFIYSVAKIYSRNEVEVLDYVNEGVIGLEKALNKFDATKGYKFLTYGVWYIRREMNVFLLTRRDTITNSAPIAYAQRKVDSIRQRYYSETGNYISDEEVMRIARESYDIKAKDEVILSVISTTSIDDVVVDDVVVENTDKFNIATSELNKYENDVEAEYRRQIIEYYLSSLSERDRDIVKMLYGIGEYRGCEFTDTDVSVKYNLSKHRIKIICDSAFARIRQKVKLA